jgi:succinoglycan biosynthesis transport protein ExoP
MLSVEEHRRARVKHVSPEAAAHTFAWREMLDQRDELMRIVRILKNRRWLIALVTIVLTLATIVAVFQIESRYAATSKLLLDPQASHFFKAEIPLLPGMLVDREVIESEMQILTSRKLAGKTVDKLGLVDDPEFNTELEPKSDLALLLEPLQPLWTEIRNFLRGQTETLAEVDAAALTRAKVIDEFLKQVYVAREGQSRVIGLTAETKSPVKSAQIANAMAELYFLDNIENQFAQRKRMATWLDDRLTEFRSTAAASQKAVEDYRRQAGLFSTRDEAGRTERIDTQQLTQISAQLIQARGDRAALEARLRTVERLDRSGGADVESVPEVMSNTVIGNLRTQEARVLQRTADLETEFGPRHPSMISSKSELQDIRANIRREIGRVLASLRNEVARARARENVLQDTYKELESRTAVQNSREIKLAELAREADVNQRILEQFLEQFKEVSARQALAEPEARIIANAEPPVLPSYPKKTMTVALAFFGSALLGCALAFLLERLNSSFRSSEEVQEATGLPVLAVIPRFGAEWRRRGLARETLEQPPSRVTEALLSLSVGLASRGFGATANRVLITSSFPGEGKSSTAISFGRMLAAQGREVLLIDADFRRPQVSTLFSLAEVKGVRDFVLGRTRVEEIVYPDPSSSMRLVPAGRASGFPGKLLEPDALAELLRQVATRNECVIVDSPPVLVVPDALVLCRLVDHTVLVTRWNKTSRQDVAKTIRQLQEVSADVAGVVLNAVDISKYAAHSYRDAKAYMRAYSRYYT